MKTWLKIGLIFLAGILTPVALQAQGQCLDYDVFLEKQALLDSIYPFSSQVYDPEWRSRKLGFRPFSGLPFAERQIHLEHLDFSKAIRKQLLTAGVLFSKIDRIEVQLFFNTSGTVDHATYRLKDNELTGLQRQMIGDSLCQWLMNYKSRLSGKGPYRTFSAWSVKDATEARRLTEAISIKGKAKRGEVLTLEELNTTRPDTVTTIRLQRLDLTEVPDVLRKFRKLKVLDLTDNELTEIPRFVFRRFKKLISLDVTGNRLTDASLRIRRNRHLEIFNLQYNKLTDLPKRMNRNRRLQSLWIGHNDLSNGIDPKVLRRLKRLHDLNLYEAGLKSLPSTISQLKRLEVLDVYHNQLRELPSEICRNLALQKLAVSYNLLEKLPEEIGNLTKLNTIYAHENQLQNLPESIVKLRSLEILDISNNKFQNLPTSISFLTANSLQELNISHNQLHPLPIAIFKINRLNLLSIDHNPLSDSTQIKSLLPLIEELEERKVRVYY